jgi:hypothetical protein
MKSKMLIVSVVALGVTLAYAVGARRARADTYACYQYDGWQLGCEGCVNQDCPACDDGTCPGRNKVCNYEEKTKIVTDEEGYLNKTPLLISCFVRWDCDPEGGEEYCSIPDVPCVKGTVGVCSQTKFVQEVLYGTCPWEDPNSP